MDTPFLITHAELQQYVAGVLVPVFLLGFFLGGLTMFGGLWLLVVVRRRS